MNQIQTKRKVPDPRRAPEGDALERMLRRQIAWAAGTEAFQHRDPLYHVTESFQQTFDAIGRRHAAQAAGETAEARRERPAAEQTPRGTAEGHELPGRGLADRDLPDPGSARSFYGRGDGRDQDMLRRFSETAFQRGAMTGAVLRGTGRMMLFSCLKKTVGQSQPVREQQRKLFGNASQERNVPGHTPDKVVFNRGFTDSAVGLVVDVLRDARRTVEDMQDLARGGLERTESGASGTDTLRAMYPFLDDRRERELLEQYQGRLRDSGHLGTEERALLQNAAGRVRALIEKKARMKEEFINKLRFLSDRAGEALAEFEEPGFPAAVDAALREALGAAEPPDGGEGADDGAAGADAGQGGPDGAAGGPQPGGTGAPA